jgi:GNAT superfamily N-acetyltransferase
MSAKEISLQPACPEDVAEILAFIQELAEYEKLSHEMQATEAEIDEWLFGERPAAEVVIARIEDQAVGFALYFTSFSTFLGRPGLYLEDLYVRPAFRGSGVGSALLRHLADVASRRGYGRLEWAVLDWNEPAIQFYERMGAQALVEWTTYRVTGERLMVMAKSQDLRGS